MQGENIMEKLTKKRIKTLILECVQDGMMKSIEEINTYLIKKGIIIESGSSALRTALFNLKKENIYFKNPEKGYYILESQSKENTDQNPGTYDFSDFITIEKSTQKETYLVVSILPDGSFALNSHLLMYFPERKAEIKIKNDCSQIALLLNGNKKMSLGKNGRAKNYSILDKVKEYGKELPVYYVGKWGDKEKIWIGNLSAHNPNRSKKYKKY